MPDTTPTEEQKQVNQILRGWQRTKRLTLLTSVSLYFWLEHYFENPFWGGLQLHLCAFTIYTFAFYSLLKRRAIKRFAKRLSITQRMALKNAMTETHSKEYEAIQAILEANPYMLPEKELLRPSQKTQDETLLRAAAYTDIAPQDQLLRPTTQEPHDPMT